jgi:hypothetical protein
MTAHDDSPTDETDAEPTDTDATLTRRDAMAALTAAGAATAMGGGLSWGLLSDGDEEADTERFGEDERATLTALATVLYPSAVTGIPAFVERYTVGRVTDRPDYASGMVEALATLDDYAQQWAGDRFADLPRDRREALLGSMGVPTAAPDPDGIDPERVRFYLVNELLFALYATPTGGELVGIENPQGYPGGTASYRRGDPGGS